MADFQPVRFTLDHDDIGEGATGIDADKCDRFHGN
jgi:hypothetical protein